MKKLDPKVKKMSFSEKKSLLKGELALINKKYKKEVVTFGTDYVQERIPFKNEDLNKITGGGAPCGKFTVIWGARGSVKTTSCYELAANAQAAQKIVLWVDFERSFDPIWATTQGINVDDLIMAPIFENAEDSMDVAIELIKTKAVDMVVIDSIQGMSPMGEQTTKQGVEKSIADDTMALLAKKLSQFFRVSSGKIYESNCTFILIGQTRTELGKFIALERLSGGNALEHWSSLTIHFRRGAKKDWPSIMADPDDADAEEVEEEEAGKKTKKKKKFLGFNVIARIDKSKVGPDEGKECSVKFMYGKGLVS